MAVPIDDLLKAKLTGPPPDHDFIESIRSWGVLVPLLVERTSRGWKLVAGKRRVKAVAVIREQGPPDNFDGTSEEWHERWSYVPAEQIHNDGWRPGSASLVENEQRSDNFSDLVDELEQMVTDGLSEREIREQTLVPISRVRRAMRATKLHKVLREAFRSGKIVRAVAESAARCTEEQQAQLVKTYKAEDQLTLSDVRAVRMASQRAEQEALAGLGEGDAGDAWRDGVVRKLREALAMVPEAEEDLRADLRLMIDAVDPLERVTKEAAERAEAGDESENAEPFTPGYVLSEDGNSEEEAAAEVEEEGSFRPYAVVGEDDE